MFYVIFFGDHTFCTCHNSREVSKKVNELKAEGYSDDEIEIVNGFIDGARMSVQEFDCEYGAADNEN